MKKRWFITVSAIFTLNRKKVRWLIFAIAFSPLALSYHCGGGDEVTSTSVSGRIATSDGKGVSGITVAASGGGTPGCGTVDRQAVTDANGYYTISSTESDILGAQVFITPGRNDYWFDPTERVVDLSYGQHLGGLDFTAFVIHVVSGRITDSSGAGVPFVTINLLKDDSVFATTMTKDEAMSLPEGLPGDYDFFNVPVGTCTIIPTGGVFDPVSRTVSIVEGEPFSGPSGQDFVLR